MPEFPSVEWFKTAADLLNKSDSFKRLGTCDAEMGVQVDNKYYEVDFEAFEPLVSARGVILFHDSIRIRPTRIYGEDKVYEHRVRDFIDELRRDARFQVCDLPFGDGLTLVRKPASPETLFARPS